MIRYFLGIVQALAIRNGTWFREKFQGFIWAAEINFCGMKTVGKEDTDAVQHVDRVSHGLEFGG